MRAAPIIVALMSVVLSCECQTAQLEPSPRAPVLLSMHSDNWKVRREGFYKLLGIDQSNGARIRISDVVRHLLDTGSSSLVITSALIDLLRTENSQAERCKPEVCSLPEDYLDYYGDVVAAVAGLHDSRALLPLLEVSSTGDMAIDAVAGFGIEAFNPVLQKVQGGSITGRYSALVILTRMLEKGKLRSHKPEWLRTRAAFFTAAQDATPLIRMAAVKGLGWFLPDAEANRVLADIAAHDPAKLAGQGENASDLYPVRRIAQDELKKHAQ
jgi:hypothetical protein